MSRSRAPVDGGYVRKTVSLPSGQFGKVEAYLKKSPGLTLSAFVTDAIDRELERIDGTRKGKR